MEQDVILDSALQALDIIAENNSNCVAKPSTGTVHEKSIHLPNHYARYFSLYSWDPDIQVMDSAFAMTRNEFLLLSLAFASITQHDDSFKPIEIRLSDLCRLFGLKLSGSTDYKAWARTINRLSYRRMVYVENKKTIVIRPYFSTCALDAETKTVILKLNSDLSEYFLHLERNKTVFNFGFLRQMSGVNTMLLYVLCASVKKGEYTLNNSLEHLKKRLNYSGENKDFIRDVLIPAIYEINQISDLNVQIQFIREGRAIVAIRFFVSGKSAEEMLEKEIGSTRSKRRKISASDAEMRAAVVDQDCLLDSNPRKEITIN